MKVERMDPNKECELWEFVARNLPPTLRARKENDGYGFIMGIEVKERSLKSYVPFTRGIASVSDNFIELRHPQYFSDFEDIITRYEAATGKEVTFRYWEAK